MVVQVYGFLGPKVTTSSAAVHLGHCTLMSGALLCRCLCVLLCGAAHRVLAGGRCAGLGSYYLASEHGWLFRTGGVQVSLWVMLCWHVSTCLLGRPLAACLRYL